MPTPRSRRALTSKKKDSELFPPLSRVHFVISVRAAPSSELKGMAGKRLPTWDGKEKNKQRAEKHKQHEMLKCRSLDK
jgi:hypothetical protein